MEDMEDMEVMEDMEDIMGHQKLSKRDIDHRYTVGMDRSCNYSEITFTY